MTWKPPKINYIPADGVTDDDLNRVEGNTLDNHDRVDDIEDGTIPAAEATNADDADKLDGKHYADIQTWVNASADVPNADHADNADNADKLDGKHLSEIFDMFHPVGDIVHRYDSSNPSALTGWSGTWVRIGVGKMLIGQDLTDGDFNALGETGGAKEHAHPYSGTTDAQNAGDRTTNGHDYSTTDKSLPTHTHDYSGDTDPTSNLSPYEVVYIWRRTA